MGRPMMLGDVIGAKAGLIARLGDFQSVAVLLAKAPARMIQMIKNAKAEGWHSCTVHGRFLLDQHCILLQVSSPQTMPDHLRDRSANSLNRRYQTAAPP